MVYGGLIKKSRLKYKKEQITHSNATKKIDTFKNSLIIFVIIDPSNDRDIEPARSNEHLGSSLEFIYKFAILIIISVHEEPYAIVVVERDTTVPKE